MVIEVRMICGGGKIVTGKEHKGAQCDAESVFCLSGGYLLGVYKCKNSSSCMLLRIGVLYCMWVIP